MLHVNVTVAIKHDIGENDSKDPPIFFQTCYMRLTHPDDEINADLFLALPANVVHTIDTSSPLCPPELRSRRTGFPRMSKRVDDFEDPDNELTSDLKRANNMEFRNKVQQYMDRSELEIIVLVDISFHKNIFAPLCLCIFFVSGDYTIF